MFPGSPQIFSNSPGRSWKEKALRKCREGCRKQVVRARKICENRLSPSPAQGGTNGTKVHEPPEPAEMSPVGPQSIWDKWDESMRRARNAGSTERENRLTAERDSSGRVGQMDAKCPNRLVRAKSTQGAQNQLGRAGQKDLNRPNRPKRV
ncbi:hypothetical protein KI387_009668, partial [Taxus chinensis]